MLHVQKDSGVGAVRRLALHVSAAAMLAAIGVGGTASASAQETVLRIGMTAADIPVNIGQPDQGFEGFRFMGYMLYDTLVLWDLSKAGQPALTVPAGFGVNGLPFGIQFAGRPFEDDVVVRVGHAYERARSDLDFRPPI